MKYGQLKKSLHKEFESSYRGSTTETRKTSCQNFTIIPKTLYAAQICSVEGLLSYQIPYPVVIIHKKNIAMN